MWLYKIQNRIAKKNMCNPKMGFWTQEKPSSVISFFSTNSNFENLVKIAVTYKRIKSSIFYRKNDDATFMYVVSDLRHIRCSAFHALLR